MTYRLELFLFLGDNVYGDLRNGRNVPDEELIDSLQESYIQASKLPGFMRARTEVTSMATWDDYDYGKNDARADFTGQRETQRLFLQFRDVLLSDLRHSRDGVYYVQTFGPEGQRVQVILPDTRFFRSP